MSLLTQLLFLIAGICTLSFGSFHNKKYTKKDAEEYWARYNRNTLRAYRNIPESEKAKYTLVDDNGIYRIMK